MTIYRLPTCHIQPIPLPIFPQPFLFGYTSAVLSVLQAVNFIHSPNGVLKGAFQCVTTSFHSSNYQLSYLKLDSHSFYHVFLVLCSCNVSLTPLIITSLVFNGIFQCYFSVGLFNLSDAPIAKLFHLFVLNIHICCH